MNMKVENEMALPITKSVTVMLLEPYAGKLARTVLRGESSRKGADLLDHFFRYNIKKQSGTDIHPYAGLLLYHILLTYFEELESGY